jgi:hypothetical protein
MTSQINEEKFSCVLHGKETAKKQGFGFGKGLISSFLFIYICEKNRLGGRGI